MIRTPRYKVCRRFGDRLFTKCQTAKYSVRSARKSSSGQGGKRPRPKSDYGLQLMDKQKIRFAYGVSERQFANYVSHSRDQGGKDAPGMLYGMLERRLDNVVFVLGWAPSRAFARQVVSHGHITVNGRKVTIPSFEVSVGDVIAVRVGSKNNAIFRTLAERTNDVDVPNWLAADSALGEAKVAALPASEGMSPSMNFASVIEFYSR
ncbi:MAG: 30S ribosomal protein S4 [Candidatus Vogelbacteria bacterium]|nr:30S ribosomal protein S4 [Candidatus Vogelbacteria bacterium]